MMWEDTWTHSQNSCIDRAQSLPKSSRSILSPLHVWLLWFRVNICLRCDGRAEESHVGMIKKGRFHKVHVVVFLNYFCISFCGRVKLYALVPHKLLWENLVFFSNNIFLCVLRICALIVFTHYWMVKMFCRVMNTNVYLSPAASKVMKQGSNTIISSNMSNSNG